MMRNLLLYILLGLFTLSSCSGDDDGGYEKRKRAKNLVRYKITCNNPIAHVTIDHTRKGTITIIGEWEDTYVTDAYGTGLYIYCLDDPLATIRCQLFVNGKKVIDKSDYQQITVGYDLK